MSDRSLKYRTILVMEDEYMLSEDIREMLEGDGAVVIGPAARLREGLSLLDRHPEIDGAVLDINLQGEMVFPLADLLAERGVPFVFTTGYDPEAIPPRFAGVLCCEKPLQGLKVRRAVVGALNR